MMSMLLGLGRPAMKGLAAALDGGRLAPPCRRSQLRGHVPDELLEGVVGEFEDLSGSGMASDHIAHGPLVWSIAGGLGYPSGITDGTIVAMLGVGEWRVHLPVKHGDTIYVMSRVTFKRETSKPGMGIVAFDREIRNQRGEVVRQAKATNMYERRTAEGE